jgi:D-amino-acid oxidase
VVGLGGVFETRTIASFDECPAEFDVVVNCTGLGSRQLTDDTDLHAERVQVVNIRQNGFQGVVIDDEGPHKRVCIVGHDGYIKLGAVFDGDVEDLTVSDDATADILARCNAVVPGLNATAEDIIGVVRAHRPERSRTRVELVTTPDGRALVHCYGHDGMGYILSWGLAQWIADQIGALAK